MKKKMIALLAAAAVFASTAYIVVYAETGTVNDPLITLSYLNQVLLPDIMAKVDVRLAEKMPAMNPTDKEAIKQEVLAALGGTVTPPVTNPITPPVDPNVPPVTPPVTPSTPTTTADVSFAAVELKNGQTMVGDTGGIEVLLRTGAFVAVVPGNDKLINMTKATEVGNDAELTLQNTYLIARNDGRGVKATTDSWLMVRGSYKILG